MPSVVAVLPEAAISYCMFDLLKRAYTSWAGVEPGVAPKLTAGVLAAFLGQALAYPLEIISRRIQARCYLRQDAVPQ